MIINKIAILINWPREVDMYNEVIKTLSDGSFVILANDINSSEIGRDKSNKLIQTILKSKKIEYKLFSNVYKKEKYKVLISTGEACSLKISFHSILKYIYAQTFGRIIEITKISNLLVKFFGRPFTADPKRIKIGNIWYPEKNLGKNVAKFPDGMDLKLKNYPYRSFEKNFDIFFTNSEFESLLIKKKFKNKICQVIGYPRYFDLRNRDILYTELKKSFKFNPEKKIIFWTPTHIDYKNEMFQNISQWVKKISMLNKKFNIIIRPHPRTLINEPRIEKNLRRHNFFVDTEPDRRIGELFKISDIVLSDYGGTIFSAIYLTKPVILLNMKKDSEFVSELKENQSLDVELRKYLINFDLNIEDNNITKSVEDSQSHEYKAIIQTLKTKYFGKKIFNEKLAIRNFLINYL